MSKLKKNHENFIIQNILKTVECDQNPDTLFRVGKDNKQISQND